MKTNLYNKNGNLSLYGLGCGYIEKKEVENGSKQMYVEHAHIHVRYTTGKNYLTPGYMAGWEVFNIDELTKARKFYNGIKLNK